MGLIQDLAQEKAAQLDADCSAEVVAARRPYARAAALAGREAIKRAIAGEVGVGTLVPGHRLRMTPFVPLPDGQLVSVEYVEDALSSKSYYPNKYRLWTALDENEDIIFAEVHFTGGSSIRYPKFNRPLDGDWLPRDQATAEAFEAVKNAMAIYSIPKVET